MAHKIPREPLPICNLNHGQNTRANRQPDPTHNELKHTIERTPHLTEWPTSPEAPPLARPTLLSFTLVFTATNWQVRAVCRPLHSSLCLLEGEGAPPELEGERRVRACAVVILRSAQQWLPPKP